MTRQPPVVGVLALQGAFAAHGRVLSALGATVCEVRAPRDLRSIEALVMPGGESTTMSNLLDRSQLRGPIGEALGAGLPALGTCAGAILLADVVEGAREDQRSFGALDITVRRNGFGRQLASFEAGVRLEADGCSGGPGWASCDTEFPGVFIRAPRIEAVGDGVTVLARLEGEPVAVARGAVWATAFHPELTADARLHRAWLASSNEALHPAGSMLAPRRLAGGAPPR